MKITRPLYAMAFAAMLLSPAFGAPVSPAKLTKTPVGTVLASQSGKTLYTFSKDGRDKSECTGKCAVNWPPFAAPAKADSAGDWTVITRSDGERQWAFKDRPLYTFAKDHKAGQTRGNGLLNGAWQVAHP